MVTSRRQIEDQFTLDDIGSTLLNELARGLYRWDEVIREYIQNAVDAHRQSYDELGTWPDKPIHIEIFGNQISFMDYGIGMNLDEVRRVKAIAVSNKRQLGMKLTGYKGVGIWAGLSFFKDFELRTSKRGEPFEYVLMIDFGTIIREIQSNAPLGHALNPNYAIFEQPADKDAHYTTVILSEPTEDVQEFLDVDNVSTAVVNHCPCPPDPSFVYIEGLSDWYISNGFHHFDILVNGQPVYRKFPQHIEPLEYGTITLNDVPVAQYWCAVHKENGTFKNEPQIGFQFFKNGFVLGKPNLYSDKQLSGFSEISVYQYLNWNIGEIHIVDDELMPDLSRRELESSNATYSFIGRMRQWYEDRHKHLRVYSYMRNFIDKYDEYTNLIEKVDSGNLIFSEEELTRLKQSMQLINEHDDLVEKHKNKPLGSKWELGAAREVRTQRNRLRNKLDALFSKLKELDFIDDEQNFRPKYKPDNKPQDKGNSLSVANFQPADTTTHSDNPPNSPDSSINNEENASNTKPPKRNVPKTISLPDFDVLLDADSQNSDVEMDSTAKVSWLLLSSLLEEVLEEFLGDYREVQQIMNLVTSRLQEVLEDEQ